MRWCSRGTCICSRFHSRWIRFSFTFQPRCVSNPLCVPGQSVVVDEPVNASRAVMPVHHPPDASGIAGCCVVAPERGTPDAPRLFLAPNGYARRIPCVGDVQGLPVSLGSILENLHIVSLLGNHLLLPCDLFLQSFQLLGHLWFHATGLLTPAIIRLFGNFQQLSRFGHLLTLTEFYRFGFRVCLSRSDQ